MNIVKTRAFKPLVMLPIAALGILPLTAKAQTSEKLLAQKDTVNTVTLNNNSEQKDTFEKTDVDSTTVKLADNLTVVQAQKDTVEVTKESVKEKGKQKIKDIITDPETKTSVGIRTTCGSSVPGAGIGAKAGFYNNNVLIGVDAMAAKNEEKSVFSYGADATYYFNLDKGWFAYPKIGLTRGKINYKDSDADASNIIAPRVAAGGKYIKDLGDVILSGSLEGGGAIVFGKIPGVSEYENSYNCQKVDVEFLAKVAAQYKNVRFVLEGGKDVNKGYNAALGVDFTF